VNVGLLNVGGVNDECDPNGFAATTAPQWPQ